MNPSGNGVGGNDQENDTEDTLETGPTEAHQIGRKLPDQRIGSTAQKKQKA
jgi:hypothetical protein